MLIGGKYGSSEHWMAWPMAGSAFIAVREVVDSLVCLRWTLILLLIGPSCTTTGPLKRVVGRRTEAHDITVCVPPRGSDHKNKITEQTYLTETARTLEKTRFSVGFFELTRSEILARFSSKHPNVATSCVPPCDAPWLSNRPFGWPHRRLEERYSRRSKRPSKSSRKALTPTTPLHCLAECGKTVTGMATARRWAIFSVKM